MPLRDPKVVVSASWGPILRKLGARLIESDDRITLEGADGWAFRAVTSIQSVFYGTQPDSLLTDDGLFGLVWERARNSAAVLSTLEAIGEEWARGSHGRTDHARDRLHSLGLWPRTLGEIRKALHVPGDEKPGTSTDDSVERFRLIELD